MSELLEFYKSQMSEKCLTCPVFVATMEAAESYETSAERITDTMLERDEATGSQPERVDHFFSTTYSTLLSMTTEGETMTARRLARLAEHGAICPTPKRGGVRYETQTSRVVSWLMNEKVCQNPGLKKILEQ